MSGSTTELALSTAVDSDDNADYLTVNLANSLRTVDALFNNVTGHTHAGAHQGGPVNTTPAAGSITSTMIADGTIATADLANAAVTNAKLASDTARANLLTNGGFEIWQRGNGPFTSSGTYAADRWTVTPGASSTLSVSRDTTNVDGGSLACAACTYTHSATSFLLQKYEDFTQLRGRTVTVSMRVRCATANAVRLMMNGNFTTAVNSAYHSGSGTYQTLTATATFATNETVAQVAVQFDASCTAYIDNAMLVVGSQAADYAPLHPADDLARCLRYYEAFFMNTGTPGLLGQATAPSSVFGPFLFKVTKAVTPSITSAGAFQGTTATGTATAGGTFVVNSNAGGGQLQGCQIGVTGLAGLVAGNASLIQGTANIYIEANP